MPTFPSVSKEQWLAKVTKDLRGKPLAELNHTVAGQELTPFHHADDRPTAPAPVVSPRTTPCGIGVAIPAGDPVATNKLILDQLNKGANALFLYADNHDPAARLDDYLAGVYREIIDVYVMHGDDHRSLDYQLFTAHNDDEDTDEVPLSACGEMLRQFERTIADGAPAKPPAFWLPVNDHYLTNVALLRAFRLCYRQLARAYDSTVPCHLIADPFTRLADKYGGMISTTAITMSAVIGGADLVFVPHGEATDAREETFLRRVALNSMNILHHEAHLDRVADPAAGSYYLEELTDRLARSIWSAFKQQRSTP